MNRASRGGERHTPKTGRPERDHDPDEAAPWDQPDSGSAGRLNPLCQGIIEMEPGVAIDFLGRGARRQMLWWGPKDREFPLEA